MERFTFSAKKLNYKKEQNSFKTQFLKFTGWAQKQVEMIKKRVSEIEDKLREVN